MADARNNHFPVSVQDIRTEFVRQMPEVVFTSLEAMGAFESGSAALVEAIMLGLVILLAQEIHNVTRRSSGMITASMSFPSRVTSASFRVPSTDRCDVRTSIAITPFAGICAGGPGVSASLPHRKACLAQASERG